MQRSPIITLIDPQVIGSGLQEDLHGIQKILWESAANICFRQGKATRLIPKGLFRDVLGADPIVGISQKQVSSGARQVWAAAGGRISMWDGVTEEDVLTLSYQEDQTALRPATYVDFTHYGDWTLINNSFDKAQLYKGTGNVAEIAEGPAQAQLYMKKFNFLLALGYGVTGTKVGWTNADDIETWVESTTGEAGEMAIEDFDTRIISGSRLGNSISVYAEDQMALVNFVNAPFYFGQKVALDGIGAVGKMSVVADGPSNFGVGRNGIWWTDGLSYKYIDEGYMRDYFQENVNWDQRSKIIAQKNDVTNCIEFYFPMGVSAAISEGWSFDPRNRAWSPLPAVSFKDQRVLFDYPVEGGHDGILYYTNQDPTQAGALSLKSKPLPPQLQTQYGLTDVHNDCLIHEIVLMAKAANNVEVRYGTSSELGDVPNWSEWITVETGTKTIKARANVPSGIYTTLEFRSIADNWDLDLQGVLVFGTVEGTKRD